MRIDDVRTNLLMMRRNGKRARTKPASCPGKRPRNAADAVFPLAVEPG